MNLDRPPGDFRRAEPVATPASGQGRMGRAWAGVKRWSGRNPRLSRVVWFTLGLALLALLIWAIYPAKNQGRRAHDEGLPQLCLHGRSLSPISGASFGVECDNQVTTG